MTRFRSRMPGHATIAAYLALFIALGGVSYAAVSLPKDSVGHRQIEKGAVRSPEVKDGSLACKDFSSKEGICADGDVREVTAAIELTCQDQTVGPGLFQRFCTGEKLVKASCGKARVLSGGYRLPTQAPPTTTIPVMQTGAGIIETRPNPLGKPSGWAVRAAGFGSSTASSEAGLQTPPNPEVTVYAVCAA